MSNGKKKEQKEGKSDKSKSEIHYVPLDVRAIESAEDDEINISEVFGKLWKRRRTIYKTVIFFALVGLIVALISVEEYTSTAIILPENKPGISLGALGGLAQQFGFSSVPQQSREELPPNIYPSITQSNVFLKQLMEYQVSVPNFDEQIALQEYVEEYQRGSVIQFLIMLPFKIKKWLMSLGENSSTSVDKTIRDSEKIERLVKMSDEDWKILRGIRDRISTSLDSETGMVTISAKMQDPLVAAQVADEVVQMLSEYISEKRTEKARQELEFIEERFEDAKSRFEQAQQELARFNDENRGQLTAMARTEQQLLQSRYDLNYNLYNSMAQRLEEARIKLQEETPVINIMEPAAIPDRRSEPKRTLILLVFTILGGIVGFGIILFQPYLENLRD